MGSKMVFDLATAQAEISRLTQRAEKAEDALVSMIERLAKCKAERDRQYDENVNRIAQQAKAEAERDEARLQLRHMEGFDCCTCFPCAIHSTETERSALAARDAAKVAEGRERAAAEIEDHINNTDFGMNYHAPLTAFCRAMQKEGGE